MKINTYSSADARLDLKNKLVVLFTVVIMITIVNTTSGVFLFLTRQIVVVPAPIKHYIF